MKKIILIAMLFATITFGQSTSSQILLGFWNSDFDNIVEQHLALNFFRTSDGELLKADGKHFLVQYSIEDSVQRYHANEQLFKTIDGNYLNTADGERFLVDKISPSYSSVWIFPTFISTISEKLYTSTATWGVTDWSEPELAYTPSYNLRDPSLIKSLDTFYCVTTVNAWDNPCTTFAILRSPDLISWEVVTYVDLSSFLVGLNKTWAPEWFIDDDSTYIIVSLTADNYQGWGGVNFQLYKIASLNSSMNLWSVATPITVDGKTDLIDGFVYKEGEYYYLFYTNQDNHYIELAIAENLNDTFYPLKEDDWAGWGNAEGMSVFKIGNKYRIYFDVWSLYPAFTPRMGISESYSLVSGWSDRIDLNWDIMHGTPLRISVLHN